MATGVEVPLDRGLTLAERLHIINRRLNQDYKKKAGVDASKKYGKIANWPVNVCMTIDGLIR